MRWATEQLGLLKPSLLLLLLLLFSVAHPQYALGQHVSETCPVNPFHSLEEPTSCAIRDNTSGVTIPENASTEFNLSATACPSIINATITTSTLIDRAPVPTNATDSIATESQESNTVLSTTSQSPASSARRTVKDDLRTEIDDSLGQSWTPELEAEYAKAQRDFELQTQAVAESVHVTPTLQAGEVSNSVSNFNEATTVPEFPSFAEWKERHLAAGLAASIQAGKDSRKEFKDTRSAQPKEAKKLKSEDAGNSTEDTDTSAERLPPSKGLDDLLTRPDNLAQVGEDDDQMALSAHTQRIFHPVPHAGSGDPLLDPLVALRDRTNYASFDCSATLIRSSKSTKFASAILSSKKDRYMLSPCSEKEKYVIVELCDEIQIDNIILANLEFFSSMFKLFRVSGGTAYPETAGSWREIGTFRASNARGMQVFRPPEPSRGGFYRYLRIDFLSHYGSEYYCPVSLLKVYGLTQLDAYRRDEERESRLASADAEDLFAEMQPAQPEEVHEEPVYLQLVEPVKVEAKTAQDEDVAAHEENSIVNLHEAITEHASPTLALPTMTSSSSSVWSVSITVPPSFSKSPATAESGGVRTSPTSSIHVDDLQSDDIHDKLVYPTAAQHESAPKSTTLTGPSSLNSQQSAPLQTAISPVTQSTSTAASSPHVSVTIETLEPELARADKTDSAARTTGSNGDRRHTSASSHAPQSPPKASSSGPSLIYRTVNSGQQQATASPARRNESKPQVIYTHGHHSTHQPNESIYGTIMKRLLALEVNSTLSTTYLEEQSRMVWDTFRRIEDRLLTMEKTRVKYDQLLRRVMLDLELHRARHEAERVELSGQLNVLSREMIMEKRLGIAQLLALVVLMFFVVLTRGSPSSPILNLANQRSPADSAVFPAPNKSRRPRSLRDEPLDAFPNIDFRALSTRERRGLGSGSRGGTYANANGHSRNASVKRSYRTSNNMTKRPVVVLPLRKNDFDYNASENPSPLGGPALSPLSSSAPSESSIHLHLSTRTSRASSPVNNGVDPVILGMADNDLSSSTITLRGSTPPLYPAAPKNRRSPVETLRRKLRLMQPRRAASLDGTNVPEALKITSSNALPSSSSVLDRRKKFSLSNAPFLRDRSDTMSSLASEGDEGNSKAWLSTSEDSGDEKGHSTPPSLGSPSFSDFARHSHSAQSSPSRYVPPSPEPSDAETPAAHHQDLPSTSSHIN